MTATSLQTSGRFLMSVLEEKCAADQTCKLRRDLGYDVFIKQQSYARLNKGSFIFAVSLSFVLLTWPVIAILIKQYPVFPDAAIVQTILTALAATAIYGYQYYKKRQVATENLLRQIVFGDMDERALTQSIIGEMAKIDVGFGFHTTGAKDHEGQPDDAPPKA